MGKKSLFESTSANEWASEKPAAEKTGDTCGENKAAQAAPETGGDASETWNRAYMSGDRNDTIGSGLKLVVGVIGGLLVLLLLASFFNCDNYYVLEDRGAVEIWKGTFTPDGRTRLMVLHGADWEGAAREVYSKEEVYTFAARFYIEKALSLTGVAGPPDYSRLESYIDRSLALVTEIEKKPEAEVIKKVKTYLNEAAILEASGKKEAVKLAEKRMQAASHAMAGLLSKETKDKGGGNQQQAS